MNSVHSISASDRGLAYGDGLFETLAVINGTAQLLDRHLARLERGCAVLGIPPPPRPALMTRVASACAAVDRGVLKIIHTRGEGGRGYRAPNNAKPTTLVQIHAWPAWPAAYASTGIAMRLCSTRLGHQPRLAGLKHLNRLEQVLARSEWQDDGDWQEGLVLDIVGNVIEATQANLFLVKNGRLSTPDLTQCGVAGVIRELILESQACEVTPVSMDDVMDADELFVCNSIIGVWPVRQVGDRTLAAPGAMTRQVAAIVLAGGRP